MGLFTKKKGIERIPEFPRLPAELPSYEPELPDFKPMKFQEIPEPEQSILPPLEIPIRKKTDFSPRPLLTEETERINPLRAEKPLFIKIDRYKEAIANIDSIKDKIKEADAVINKIYDLKSEEERELTEWHSTLTKIKEKLIAVDKKLFES